MATQMQKPATKLILVSLVAVLTLLFLFLTLSAEPKAPQLSVKFAGYTNSSGQEYFLFLGSKHTNRLFAYDIVTLTPKTISHTNFQVVSLGGGTNFTGNHSNFVILLPRTFEASGPVYFRWWEVHGIKNWGFRVHRFLSRLKLVFLAKLIPLKITAKTEQHRILLPLPTPSGTRKPNVSE